MADKLAWFNSLPTEVASDHLHGCCASTKWTNQMLDARPFASFGEMTGAASRIWWSLQPADWIEAFHGHPKIGEKKAVNETSSQAQHWATQEQSSMRQADTQTGQALAALNKAYEAQFGYIFIICATGKAPRAILTAVQERLKNTPDQELGVAAGEQAKITELRLRKLFDVYT
ncbi:MAG: 2-oxo-4-hydroxy-4-carboxy-5-ureidoimidazoline decarboxylase [Pyrinomonadaceae bacterium]